MTHVSCSGFLAATVALTLVPCVARAQTKAPEAQRAKAQIVDQQRTDQKEPIEAVQDFLEGNLDANVSYQIRSYSGPQSVRFQRKKAAVLRVVYEVTDQPAGGATRDQLFLVQDGNVKQWVDFASWLAEQQEIQQLLIAQEIVIQQQQMAALAQPTPVVAWPSMRSPGRT